MPETKAANPQVCTLLQQHFGIIKELMRRSAQFLLESGGENLENAQVGAALDEMLFSGGSLNARLLRFAPKSQSILTGLP